MKTVIIFCTLISSSVFACIPKPTYVDLWNIQEFVNISTESNLILRSRGEIVPEFKHDSSIKIEKIKNSSIGGLTLYEVNEESRPLKTKITISSSKKKILLNISLSKRVKQRGLFSTQSINKGGGCGKTANIEYY